MFYEGDLYVLMLKTFFKKRVPLVYLPKNNRKIQKKCFFEKISKSSQGATTVLRPPIMVFCMYKNKNTQMVFTKERCVQNLFFSFSKKTDRGTGYRKIKWGGRLFFPSFTKYHCMRKAIPLYTELPATEGPGPARS